MNEDIRHALTTRLSVDPQTAGAALGLKKTAAYRAVAAGQISAEKIGGKWMVPTAPLRRKLGIEAA